MLRIVALLIGLGAYPADSQTLDPIRYTVSFPAPHTHYVEVDASVPTEGQPHLDLMMPVWTPGSYSSAKLAPCRIAHRGRARWFAARRG